MFRRGPSRKPEVATARAGTGPRRRALDRVVLGVLLSTLLALAGLPFGLTLAHAEPQIQLLNPTNGTSLVVSDKQREYHLNAWVKEVPPDPLVEYELDVTRVDPSTGTTMKTILLGDATRSNNGFGLLWDMGDLVDTLADGPIRTTYVLRTILYAGYTGPGTGVQIAVDEAPITINHKDDPDPTQHSTEDAGENVRITYPTNGGPLGVYIRPKGGGGNFTIDAIVSQHTRFLRPFYTLSQPGEEPVWKSCGIPGGRFKTVEGVRTARIRCATAAGDYALNVTGVAVVTNDTPAPTPAGQAQRAFDDGADAQVVTPYFQRVASITIDPPTISDVDTDIACPTMTATVLDQLARPIGNMNVDLHVEGPSDQVRFGTVFPAPDANNLNKPPDQGHDLPESAQSCLEGPKAGLGGQQGEHNVVGGLDTKHIESTSGTDLAGTFMFALTADRAGASQIIVWGDEDDDDFFCFDETAGSAAIGWRGPAPAPSGLPPTATDCPVTVPPPTPSPSPSPSEPSPTATGGSNLHERSVDIQFGHAPLIVSGHVMVPDGAGVCVENVPVKVQRKVDGRYATLEETTTNENGRYVVELKDRPGRYRAVTPKVEIDGAVCAKASAAARHIH